MPTKSDVALPGARAIARHVHTSATKARRMVNLIRGLPAREALTVLQFAPQAASEPVYKVLASAVANAENNERLDPDALLVAEAYVDEGPTLKRFRPRAQGRAYRIRKRTCHITVVVESVTATGEPGRPIVPGRRGAAQQSRSARSDAPNEAAPAETPAEVEETGTAETPAPAKATKKAAAKKAAKKAAPEAAPEPEVAEDAAEEETE